MASRVAIGMDVGATKVRVCVGDAAGRILWKEVKVVRPPDRVEGYLRVLSEAAAAALRRVPQGAKAEAAGVASIGPLDVRRGRMVRPPNLPYREVPVAEAVERATGLRVELLNDATAAALAEHRFGAGKGRRNVAYVTLSTGIGGGAVVDGSLLMGKDGNAAEVGHVTVDSEGRLRCGCGGRGHWEAYCSGRGIPAFARLLAGEEGREETRDAAALLKAAGAGEPFAKGVAEKVSRLNALGFANVANMFDPEVLTVGGAVALNNPETVVGPISRLLRKAAINRAPEVRLTPLGDDAGILGAVAAALGGTPRGSFGREK